MESIFFVLLKQSIESIGLILFIILLRTFFKKIPHSFFYIAWIIVFINLVCPAEIDFSFLFNNSVAANQTNDTLSFPIINGFKAVSAGLIPNQEVLETPKYNIFFIIWILGFLILFFINIFKIFKLKKLLKNEIKSSNSIFISNKTTVPFVLGWIKPQIYIPANLSENEKEYILLHEKIHIKRKDNIIKTIAYFILILNWYNPFVWIAYFMLSEDIECSCDTKVIKHFGKQIKKDYFMSLLKMASSPHIFETATVSFGEYSTKRRISNILNYKKPTKTLIITLILVFGVICFTAFAKTTNDVPYSNITNSNYSQKSVDVDFNNKTYTLSLAIPNELDSYVEFTSLEDYPVYLLTFNRDNHISNIGMFEFFTEEEYDKMDPTQMPVPTEILRQDNIVIGFSGLHDMPFELETEEAKLVGNYHENVSDMLKTVTLTEK